VRGVDTLSACPSLIFQPTLVGATVIVRPISSADWPELFAAGSDPEIWKVHPYATATPSGASEVFRWCGRFKNGICIRRSSTGG